MVQTPKTIAQRDVATPRIPRAPRTLRLSDRIAQAMFGARSGARAPVDQRRARVIQAFAVAVGAPMIVAAIELGIVDPRPDDAGLAWLLTGGAAWALCAFLLARAGQNRVATGLTIALLWLAPATYLGVEMQRGHATSPWAASWLAISIVVAAALARPATIVLAASGAIVVPAAFASGPQASAALGPSVFLAGLGLVTFLLAYHREAGDREEIAVLHRRNAELVAEGQVQKKRIDARAAELRRAHDEIDRAQRALSDQKRKLTRSESIVSITRETAEVVHETMAPMATVLGALSEARSLSDEYMRSLEDPDTTDADHRAIADRLARALDRARQAAEKSAALVHSADVELHLVAPQSGSEIRKTVKS